MIRMMLLIPFIGLLLSCGLFTRADDPATQVAETPVASTEGPAEQADSQIPQVGEPALVPPPTGGPPPSVDLPPSPYVGDSLIEEKIVESSVVVKATMTAFSSEIVVVTDIYSGSDNKYSALLTFSLNVSEYLKGTGPSSIVAVWVDGRSYDTNDEANNAKTIILAERDAQWDDREALIFLYGDADGFGTQLDEQLQRVDHFLLYVGDPYSPDDFYSLHSRTRKAWLPATTTTGSTGDDQEFLLDVPPPTETITLGDLKRRITEVTAEYNGGDGSQAYRDCVVEKYRYIRNQRNFPEEMGRPFTLWNSNQSLVSGQPTGTVLDRREAYGGYPDTRTALWVEGRDSALFDTADGDSTASDTDGDGEYDTIKYDQAVTFARPIPAGEYRFDLKEPWRYYVICKFVISTEWTVTVTAPDGTLHEAFFDPVTVGNAVAADGANGVLKPTTFTDTNGVSATIERIAWEASAGESGTVKLELSPHNGITGHVVDFIALDGSVVLTLNVADATVDAANDTLNWMVASQPWQSGDKLMLRIREAPDR